MLSAKYVFLGSFIIAGNACFSRSHCDAVWRTSNICKRCSFTLQSNSSTSITIQGFFKV